MRQPFVSKQPLKILLNLSLVEGLLLYNIGLASAIPQHESATGIPMSPLSRISLPPPTPGSLLLAETGME